MTNFKTEIFNHSGSKIYANMYLDGLERILIQPTPEGVLSGTIEQPRECLFAPYSRIVYRLDGTKAKKRSGFKPTKGPWTVELLNESQIDIQILNIGLKNVFIPKGITVYYQAEATSQVAEYLKVWWTTPEGIGEHRYRNRGGMIEAVEITRDIWKVRREPKELEKLFEVRASLIAKKNEQYLQFEAARSVGG